MTKLGVDVGDELNLVLRIQMQAEHFDAFELECLDRHGVWRVFGQELVDAFHNIRREGRREEDVLWNDILALQVHHDARDAFLVGSLEEDFVRFVVYDHLQRAQIERLALADAILDPVRRRNNDLTALDGRVRVTDECGNLGAFRDAIDDLLDLADKLARVCND